MSIVRITSWNAQGNGIDKISQSYSNILPNGKDNILLLQEAGSTYGWNKSLSGNISQSFGNTDYRGYFVPPKDAKNNRCTTGIMASVDSLNTYSMGFFKIEPFEVNRPIVIATAQFKNFYLYIVTVHATAEHHVSGPEIEYITDKLGKNAKKLGWQYLIMGDFNITPQEFIDQYSEFRDNVIYTGTQTQKSGNELDYAIASSQLIAENIEISHGDDYGSDHYPIYIEFDSDMSLKS